MESFDNSEDFKQPSHPTLVLKFEPGGIGWPEKI